MVKLIRWLRLALVLLACARAVVGQVLVTEMPPPLVQFLDNNGKPLGGGFVYTCPVSTTCPGTPLTTYTDFTGSTPQLNPVILNAGGFGGIWLQQGASYRIVVQNSNHVQQYVIDGIGQVPNLTQRTTTDQTTVGLAFLNVMSVPLAANTNYAYSCQGIIVPSLNTTSPSIITAAGINPTWATVISFAQQNAGVVSGNTVGAPGVTGLLAVNLSGITGGTAYAAMFMGEVETNTAGNFVIQIDNGSGSGTMTLKRGFTCAFTKSLN